MGVIQRRWHKVSGFGAGITEHDALVAGAFVFFAAGVNALRNIGGLPVEQHVNLGVLPMETGLLVTDVFDPNRAKWAMRSRVMVAGPRVSPAITTRLVVARVSQATRTCEASSPLAAASRKKQSTTSSEMRSQTLSGCPSETDSLVNKYDARTL